MLFGIREVCDCYFYDVTTKEKKFEITTAKMSTLEGASATVYAQGGQGNPRLLAWEGDRTLTFTVEDALLSTDSLSALLGTEPEGNVYTMRADKFAGYYTIEATTFVRDENGIDHVATITIPKAKLQSNINIPMSPTGDPSTFTFTFDAFANRETKEIFNIEINNIDTTATTISKVTVKIGNEIATVDVINTEEGAAALMVTAAGDIILFASETSQITFANSKVGEGEFLTNLSVVLPREGSIALKPSTSTWYII